MHKPRRFVCGTLECSIEHLAHCSVARGFYWQYLQLPAPHPGHELESFLGLFPISNEMSPVNVAVKFGLGIYAVSQILNKLRHGALTEEQRGDAFHWFVREGLRWLGEWSRRGLDVGVTVVRASKKKRVPPTREIFPQADPPATCGLKPPNCRDLIAGCCKRRNREAAR